MEIAWICIEELEGDLGVGCSDSWSLESLRVFIKFNLNEGWAFFYSWPCIRQNSLCILEWDLLLNSFQYILRSTGYTHSAN